MNTDSSVGFIGWSVDDITVYTCAGGRSATPSSRTRPRAHSRLGSGTRPTPGLSAAYQTLTTPAGRPAARWCATVEGRHDPERASGIRWVRLRHDRPCTPPGVAVRLPVADATARTVSGVPPAPAVPARPSPTVGTRCPSRVTGYRDGGRGPPSVRRPRRWPRARSARDGHGQGEGPGRVDAHREGRDLGSGRRGPELPVAAQRQGRSAKATKAKYKLAPGDKGKRISVRVTGTQGRLPPAIGDVEGAPARSRPSPRSAA